MKAVTKSLAMILAGLAWNSLAYTCEIHRAARQGHVEKVRGMLVADPGLAKQQCLDIGDFWLNGTPLHWASSSGQEEVVEYLLAHEVDVNAKAVSTLYTPLHMAAEFGNKGVVELLLSHKADVDAKEKKGRTPLRIALDTQEKISETEMPLKKDRLQALGETIGLLRSRGAKE